MNYRYKTCLLLTACVNPMGMSYTVLQDPDLRAKQYKEALDYYLKETDVPIVFCENTMYDMSSDYKLQIDSGRLEYFTFNGNNYEKIRGKGYGEALIMNYALCHSNILSQTKYVIKITGRLIVTDIRSFISSPLFCLNNLFRCNIKSKFISTYIFVSRPLLIKNFISKYQERIKEDSPTNDLIEHHLYRALTKDAKMNSVTFIPFMRIPNVVGISGTTGQPYSMKDRLIGNLAYSFRFEMDRNNRMLACFYLFEYYVLYYFELLKKRIKQV